MAECLIALGSNLGDRAANLRRALGLVAAAPQTQLLARSAWHETAPVGGPAGQGAYLNAAALIETLLTPAALGRELQAIESQLGRQRTQRWDARTIDLDLALYGDVALATAELTIPHPRMHYRRFVLAPAAEVAPWMVHPECRWTIARLLGQLDAVDDIAVAAVDPHLGDSLVERLERHFELTASQPPRVRAWSAETAGRRPKLILAAVTTGSGAADARKMLQLPASGPVAWLAGADADAMFGEALAVVGSARPARANH
jgi:2-amino-4-hydroxy-6-hydroxymethyldihydropteridine diphosphokinase